jgi:hypothetical protein
LNQPDAGAAAFGVFLGLCVLTAVLRIVLCVGLQTQYALFRLNAKSVTSKADLEKIRFGMLKNIIADYIRTAERNVAGVHLDAITHKYLLKLSFIGWSFDSMERFITGFELMLPVAGLAMALIVETLRTPFGVTAAGAFLLLRILAAVFDFQLAREKLAAEIVEYVEREIGQYYNSDFGAALKQFTVNVAGALSKQAESLRDVIQKLESNLSGAVGLILKEMSSELAGVSGALHKPLQAWSEAITSAIADTAGVQQKSAESLRLMDGAVTRLKSASEALEVSLKNHTAKLAGLFDGFGANTEKLADAGQALRQSTENAQNRYGVIDEQVQYIKKNQALLEKAVVRYEQSLEGLTLKMGDGFGGILEFHIQKSYQALNENLQNNIGKITAANQDLIQRLQALFEQIIEQSRVETSAIVHLNDQMSLQFDELANKML